MRGLQGRLRLAGPPECHVAPVLPGRGAPQPHSQLLPPWRSHTWALASVGGCWHGGVQVSGMGGQDGAELPSPCQSEPLAHPPY